jgi:hypothetical protein
VIGQVECDQPAILELAPDRRSEHDADASAHFHEALDTFDPQEIDSLLEQGRPGGDAEHMLILIQPASAAETKLPPGWRGVAGLRMAGALAFFL